VKKDREEVSNDRHNPSNDVEWLPWGTRSTETWSL
jgi:hypothetical protein